MSSWVGSLISTHSSLPEETVTHGGLATGCISWLLQEMVIEPPLQALNGQAREQLISGLRIVRGACFLDLFRIARLGLAPIWVQTTGFGPRGGRLDNLEIPLGLPAFAFGFTYFSNRILTWTGTDTFRKLSESMASHSKARPYPGCGSSSGKPPRRLGTDSPNESRND